MTNYDLLNQDKAKEEPCPICKGIGWYVDHAGIKGNTEAIIPCACGINKPMLDETTRKVSDLTIADLYELIPKIVRECKRQDDEQAEREYRKLTGTKVPREY